MGVAQDIIQSLKWGTVQIIKIRFVDERLVSDEMSLKVAQKPYYEQENINFKLWEGDELVTCTEDQEICAISGRNGIIWQIINHFISHSLFICTYY